MTAPRDPDVADPDASPSPVGASARPEAALRTFLIADIRGYTTYTREHGDEAGAALAARFAELVAEVVSARDGFLVELRGDEALVAFVSARKALRAAIDLQARFVEAKLPRGVGIGLDAGEAIPVGNGYRGTALNLAARLCAKAAAGETLASEAVIHLAAKVEGIAYVDARELKFKGYSDSVRVVVVMPSERSRGHRLASRHGSVRRDRTRYAIGGVVGVVVVALIVVVLDGGLLGRGGPGTASPSGASSLPPDPLGGAALPVLAFYDDQTGDLKATTQLTSPRNIAFFSDGSFWILDGNRAFNRIDPISHKVVQSVVVPLVEAWGFNFDDDSIWVTDLAAPHVIRIDKRTGVVSDFPFGADASDEAAATDVAIGGGSVWLARPDVLEVVRLDATTGEVQARLDVEAWGVTFGSGGLWYWREGLIGRIDAVTNEPTFEPIQLSTDTWLGNIYIGGGDAWTSSTSTGRVWRVDRSGRQTSFALEPGIGEMASTDRTMWVTNAETGALTGIDLVTGEQDRVIDTGHATLAVAAGGDEIMVAVGPTVDEAIADLDGSVLTIATAGMPWKDPGAGPDPALNWSPEVRQALYLTCVGLLNYADKAAPEGWKLEPEVAAGMPTVSPDGRTYTFTIRPGFVFSPPSNEPVTAETFRATLERALSPVFNDDTPGIQLYGDIVGAEEYHAGTIDHVTGLAASEDQLTITLQAPAPDFLHRLALSFACPVPAGTPALRSGLDPDPPISGAGPYYLADTIRKRLVVFLKNPNYQGSRPRPFDAIAIKMNTAPASAISQVQSGKIDAAMLPGGDPISGPGSTIAAEWGPGSTNAAQGDQRWFGAPGFGVDFMALNPTRPAFRDPDVRRAVSLALDRTEISAIWVTGPTAQLLAPSVPGSAGPDAPVPSPDLEAARALMNGRTFEVTMMGYPTEWGCGACREFEVAVTRQLKDIGITVTVRHSDDFPGDALDPGSDIDLLGIGSGTDVPDPVSLMGGLHDDPWLGEANLAELTRLEGLSGQARVDGAVEFAHRLVDEEALILPTGFGVYSFYMSERIGCGFVQPAIGAVDLLSLCIRDGGATPTSSANPAP